MHNETRLTSLPSDTTNNIIASQLYVFGSGVGSVPDHLNSASQIQYDLNVSSQATSATVFN